MIALVQCEAGGQGHTARSPCLRIRRPELLEPFHAESFLRCRSGGRGAPSDQETIEPIGAMSKISEADMVQTFLLLETKTPPVWPGGGIAFGRRSDGLFGGLAEGLIDLFTIGIIDGIERVIVVLVLILGGRLIILEPGRELHGVRLEQRSSMDEAVLSEMRDQCRPRVLDALARQDRRVLAGCFERRTRQARQEFLRAHIGEEAISADGIAGNARDDPALGPT